MSVIQLRRRISRRMKDLSEERLRVADDFLAYLLERQDNSATRELMSIPGFVLGLKKAESQASSGKTVRWAKVRRNV